MKRITDFFTSKDHSEKPSLNTMFREFHERNPHIYEAFSKFTFQLINRGRTYGGAKMIIERIRWEAAVSGDDGYKINNNYAPCYARMFMGNNEIYKGFFRTKEGKNHGNK